MQFSGSSIYQYLLPKKHSPSIKKLYTLLIQILLLTEKKILKSSSEKIPNAYNRYVFVNLFVFAISRGIGNIGVREWEVQAIGCKTGSRMNGTTRGIGPTFHNSCKWKVTLENVTLENGKIM